jgi:transcriptional regulator with XRE-family HTH domain
MSDPVDLHLGRRLRSRRRMLRLTQGDLGAALGIRFQQIQKFECGATRMTAAILWRLAGALRVEVDYFYEGLPCSTRPKAIESPAVPSEAEKSQGKSAA